jgi:hypothetical protein
VSGAPLCAAQGFQGRFENRVAREQNGSVRLDRDVGRDALALEQAAVGKALTPLPSSTGLGFPELP